MRSRQKVALAQVLADRYGDRLLTAKEVAEYLNVSINWVHDHARRSYPRIAAVKLGEGRKSAVRFRIQDIEDFVEQHWTPSAKRPPLHFKF